MILAIAILVAGGCLVVLFVAVAREPGLSAADTAIAYEAAWDRLDFPTLHDLSGDELRDGLDRRAFAAAKEAVYARLPERGRLLARVEVVRQSVVDGADGQAVSLVTCVTTSDGAIYNDLALERRGGRWVVVAYALRSDVPDAPDLGKPDAADARGVAEEPIGPAATG